MKKTKIPASDKNLKRIFRDHVIGAIKGKHPWVDEIIRKAGYINPGEMRGKDLANLYGIKPASVACWHSRYGLKRSNKKTYKLPDVIKWREDRLKARIKEEKTGDDIADAKLKYKQEQVKILEFNRLQREGELVDRAELIFWSNRMVDLLRQCGESLGREYGPRAQEKFNDVLENLINEIDNVSCSGSSKNNETNLPKRSIKSKAHNA